MNSLQAVTIVSSGGTPIQLADQRGAPYPTTGYGALVYNVGPHLIDVILENAVLGGPFKLVPGTFYDPSIQFTMTEAQTPGFYSTGPGNISLVGTDGLEASRAHLAQFNHPGDLLIPRHVYADGTIVANEDSSMLATTRWVNTNFLSNSESDALYVKKTGDTMTGDLLVGAPGTLPGDKGTWVFKDGWLSATGGAGWAGIDLWQTDAGPDLKGWDLRAIENGSFNLTAYSDVYAVQKQWVFSRAGVTSFPGLLSIQFGSRKYAIDTDGYIAASDFYVTSIDPYLGFYVQGAASTTDARRSYFGASGADFAFTFRSDAYVDQKKWTFKRSDGSTTFPGPLIGTTANFSGVVNHLTPPLNATGTESVTAAWLIGNNYVTGAILGNYVAKGGDTMFGPLVMPVGSPTATSLNFGAAGNGFYATASDLRFATSGILRFQIGNTAATLATVLSHTTPPAGAVATESVTAAWVIAKGYQTVTGGNAAYAPISHTHSASQITDFAEATDDRVAALLVAGANVTLTYNDAAGSLTIASTGGGGGIAEAPLDGQQYARQSAAWSVVTGGGGGGAVTVVSPTPPATPTVGQMWFNSDSIEGGGQTYLWYADGTSSQWVPATPIPASGGGGGGSGDFMADGSVPMTGPLTGTTASFSGNVTVDTATSANAIVLGVFADLSSFNMITLNSDTSLNGAQGLAGGADANLYHLAQAGGDHIFRAGGVEKARISSAGALTGTTATFTGTVSAQTFSNTPDASAYALTANRFSSGYGRAVISTGGAYGLDLQSNAATVVRVDPTLVTFYQPVVVGGFAVGYLDIPQNIQAASYGITSADAGKHIYHAVAAAAATYTIPSNAAVPFALGTTLTFVNDSVNNVTIAITTDTMVLSPGTTTGSRTLATGGVATAVKVTTTRWIISGSGLT